MKYNDSELIWEKTESREILHTPIFDVKEQHEKRAISPNDAIDAIAAADGVALKAFHF